MKAILFFVSAGFVAAAHKEAAAAIAAATGKKVVFRNATAATFSGENPEPNEGVAGKVPESYAKFTRYDDAGQVIGNGSPVAAPAALADRKLNVIGLPDGEGCPEDREALKAALEAEGIDFHGNAKTEKLADLYLAHFYPANGEG
jgi:hypothetical protein